MSLHVFPSIIPQMAYELGCFEARHGRAIGTGALGTFLSNRLYLHRLQPMYALNLVAGLDAQGTSSVEKGRTGQVVVGISLYSFPLHSQHALNL